MINDSNHLRTKMKIMKTSAVVCYVFFFVRFVQSMDKLSHHIGDSQIFFVYTYFVYVMHVYKKKKHIFRTVILRSIVFCYFS